MVEYFARAAPKWSCVPRSSEPAREARARAWERVLGGCLVPFTRAAWASAAEEAVERLVTFSEMVLPKSTKDSFYPGLGKGWEMGGYEVLVVVGFIYVGRTGGLEWGDVGKVRDVQELQVSCFQLIDAFLQLEVFLR